MSARVIDLVGGDVVQMEMSERSAVFIGRSDHPMYPGLALVVWRLDNGGVSLDALSPLQVVGDVISGPSGHLARLDKAVRGTWSREP